MANILDLALEVWALKTSSQSWLPSQRLPPFSEVEVQPHIRVPGIDLETASVRGPALKLPERFVVDIEELREYAELRREAIAYLRVEYLALINIAILVAGRSD